MQKRNISILNNYISIVLFCIYIFPSGLMNNGVLISKYLFLFSSILLYLIDLIKNKEINLLEIIYISFILMYSFFSKNIEFLMLLTLPLLLRLIKYKQKIKKYLKESKFIYICLLFTLIYSFIFHGFRGRYAFTAIKEINQSGLAIFCLACLLYFKNKKIGIVTFCFGMLTISRSYYLAIIILIIYNRFIRNRINNDSRFIKLFNYKNCTIITSLIFILLGSLYLYKYYNNEIIWEDNISKRLFNIFDASNFFRFTAVINLLNIIKLEPKFILTGMSQYEYIKYGILSSSKLKIPYRYTVPHNLFFSHLKIYGFFSIFETIIISNIFNKLANKENFGLFIGLILYNCFLGAGFYSYWIYLSTFLMIMYNGEDYHDKYIKKNNS